MAKKAETFPIEFPDHLDYSGRKVLCGISAGINSAAALCWLAQAPVEKKPTELHLFYAHLTEHSPDSRAFAHACVVYARQHFTQVVYMETEASALALFEEQKMIPHPTVAPCTRILKLEPMYAYMTENGITDNVVGYINAERRRVNNMAEKGEKTPTGVLTSSGVESQFPIVQFSNEWCFQIVDREIGWHPAIYDIRNTKGERVFKHNNCLPCKNMTYEQMADVQRYYPAYFERAQQTAQAINKHWGRDADSYYSQFGRPEWEVPNGQPCLVCAAD